ncbi:hypothetical protein C8R44DRAFT_730243 [Mycena epipterygia]|nr:hypothetical protein C8R44DRAFT_730243 [Mycena epipterygia]
MTGTRIKRGKDCRSADRREAVSMAARHDTMTGRKTHGKAAREQRTDIGCVIPKSHRRRRRYTAPRAALLTNHRLDRPRPRPQRQREEEESKTRSAAARWPAVQAHNMFVGRKRVVGSRTKRRNAAVQTRQNGNLEKNNNVTHLLSPNDDLIPPRVLLPYNPLLLRAPDGNEDGIRHSRSTS